MKGTYIFLADGFEEIEALATVDVLRRGASMPGQFQSMITLRFAERMECRSSLT